MTLASVFLIGVFSLPSSLAADAVYLPAQATSSQDSQGKAQATESVPEKKPSTSKPAKTSSATTSSRKPRAKKKATDACKAAAVPANASGSSTGSSAPTGQTANPAIPPKNCPPPKIVVRQGGTSEPSIQLAGGATGSQTTQAKDNVTQMLDSTEGNLKKLSERQLGATEQDAVAQIRQFMDQSKAAVVLGDTERARTLAWKAQTLSDDLVNPKK